MASSHNPKVEIHTLSDLSHEIIKVSYARVAYHLCLYFCSRFSNLKQINTEDEGAKGIWGEVGDIPPQAILTGNCHVPVSWQNEARAERFLFLCPVCISHSCCLLQSTWFGSERNHTCESTQNLPRSYKTDQTFSFAQWCLHLHTVSNDIGTLSWWHWQQPYLHCQACTNISYVISYRTCFIMVVSIYRTRPSFAILLFSCYVRVHRLHILKECSTMCPWMPVSTWSSSNLQSVLIASEATMNGWPKPPRLW